MTEKLYQHSGQSSPDRLILAIVTGGIVTVFLAYLYNLLIVIIPIVYLNFLFTIGFGSALGYVSKFTSRFAKIRNQKHNLVLAGVLGLIGYYCQWIAYLVYLETDRYEITTYAWNLFLNPITLLKAMYEISLVGTWSLFNIPFKDFPLWIIWALEATIIIGVPIYIIHKHPILPFSESLRQWYPKHILKYQFQRIATQNEFKERLLSNPQATIESLSYGDSYRFSEVSIYFLKGTQEQYLSVDNVLIEGRGKGKTDKDPVIHLVRIDTVTAENLMKKFGAKKMFFMDY